MNTVEPLRKLQDYYQHLLDLDKDARYLRFGFPITSASIERFIATLVLHPHRHQIFAIYDGEVAVGIGHVSRHGPELAFSVLASHRKQGMGSSLMSHCLAWCREEGYTDGYMMCLSTNTAIRRLAARNGMIMTTEQGETQAKFQLGTDPLQPKE